MQIVETSMLIIKKILSVLEHRFIEKKCLQTIRIWCHTKNTGYRNMHHGWISPKEIVITYSRSDFLELVEFPVWVPGGVGSLCCKHIEAAAARCGRR